MSPELLESSDLHGGAPTFASDIYALAMVFYEVSASLTEFGLAPP